jgi:hypothetical protein
MKSNRKSGQGSSWIVAPPEKEEEEGLLQNTPLLVKIWMEIYADHTLILFL